MNPNNPAITRAWFGTVPTGIALMVCSLLAACSAGPSRPAPGSGDSDFSRLAGKIVADYLRRNPSRATSLGVHTYDADLDDFSHAAIIEATAAMKRFRTELAAIDPGTLSPDKRLDREHLLRAMDAGIFSNEVTRPWAKDADAYSGGITNAAYVIMKRAYAPAAERLKALVGREKKMPAAFAEARKNLDNPPRIFTEIAIEQIDGNISFFMNDVPAAFKEVTDKALLADFKKANGGVLAALGDYKKFLEMELLPKSNGNFTLGHDNYVKALAAAEMVELPLVELLKIAEADRRKNEDAFQATAREIDPKKTTAEVHAALESDHPSPDSLLKATQAVLDSLRQFIVDHHVITIPPSEPARVKETPPFMRSTTSASMDAPGPFETAKLEAFYNMTLPDPRWKQSEQAEYMKQWYYALITNVSVHEVYPGHYIQFLYAKSFPSDARRVYRADTNVEGWAHYCEQMMLEEGFHAGEPKYRLAQLQDALLRDVRFIVGIKLHTQGLSIDEATKLFEAEAHQPHPVAVQEAKRGAGDPLYGYYTMGKLMILKLREDYRRKMGPQYSLQDFHDTFIRLGPLPLPLVRKAMLGDAAGSSLF